MKIKKSGKSLALITAIVMMFTVFTAFSGGAATHAASEIKMNIKGTVTSGPLNVRSGAGTNYKVISSLEKGKTVTVLTKKEDKSGDLWYKYKISTLKYGYVNSKFIKLKENTVTDKVTNFTRKATVKSSTLKVRAGSGSVYEQLGSLKKDDIIYIDKKVTKASGKTWYRFSYDGRNGYVNGDYIKLTVIVSETDINQKAIVKEGPLNVRTGPGTGYNVRGSLAEGKSFQALQIIKKTNGLTWYKYKYSDSKYGYVSGEFVELTKIVTEAKLTRKALVTSSTLKVRNGAGSENKQIGTLEKGDAVFISKKMELVSGVTWYQIKFEGKTAYINGKFVKLTEITKETALNKKGTIKAATNVRSGPKKTYDLLGKVEKGKTITFTKMIENINGGVWYEYKYSSDQYGYIHGDYVKMSVTLTFKQGTITTDSGISLNVRSDAGSEYSKLGSLASGAIVAVLGSKKASDGKVWYNYQFSSSKKGWICSDYVKIENVKSESEFEEYMDEQGFPDSFKPYLRVLKAEHPKWVFKAYDVGCTWKTAVDKENAKPGLNVIDTSLPKSWRSKDSDCYNAKTGVWSRYDGRWYSAHTDVIRYYMDPRNFLNDDEIYQFLTHKYNAETQNIETVKAVVKGTFMETRKPGGWKTFAALINAAGKNSGVNPNVLAAMIIQEQGSKGTSGLISGTYSGYKGYYNFLNIGAYTTSTMTAVQRGLWYAKQQGWNTEYKSIKGGADIYHDNYVDQNQYLFYTKKFNVMNGTDKIGSHQYMTNVQGAYGEALQLKKAFPDNYSKALTFIIPVYDSMPLSPCDLP